MSHVMPIGESTVPKELSEKCLRELGIFPTAILQEFQAIIANVCVFDEFFDVAER